MNYIGGFSYYEKCEWLPEIEINGYKVPADSFITGKSIAELKIRKRTGVTVIAIRRVAEVTTNPAPDFEFKRDDSKLFTGEKDAMKTALHYL